MICNLYSTIYEGFFQLDVLFSNQGGHSHLESPEAAPLKEENTGDINNVDSTENCSSESTKQTTPLSTLIVMLLVGDVIHSFNDGMAIGGAFSKSESDGLSTSLAVLFHEVPHVVGMDDVQSYILCSNQKTRVLLLLGEGGGLGARGGVHSKA